VKGKKAPAFGAMAFGENDHAAAGADSLNALIDGANRLADIFPVNVEAAEDGDPDIDKGEEYQFFLGYKAEGTAAVGKEQKDIKHTVMVAYKTHAAIFGDIFLSPYRYSASCAFDYQQGPALGHLVNKNRK
jgi:hypothetical protein